MNPAINRLDLKMNPKLKEKQKEEEQRIKRRVDRSPLKHFKRPTTKKLEFKNGSSIYYSSSSTFLLSH